MKTSPKRQKWFVLLLRLFAFSVAIITPTFVSAQSARTGVQQPAEAEAQAPPVSASQDPITQLNLSPEQRQQIRSIREKNKDERAAINRRLRETTVALDQALDSDAPNEALIEQRVREAGEAQTAVIRLRALTETRIRKVLTLEQINTLRQLRAQTRRELRQENRIQNGRPAVNERQRPNQRNGMIVDPNLRRNNPTRRPLE